MAMREGTKLLIGATATSIVRGLIWLIAGWMNTVAATNGTQVEIIAAAAGTLVVLVASMGWSVLEKKGLLNTEPPDDNAKKGAE